MKISIIVPVYNGEKYFAECIQSILDQSFTDIEVIVINDGSTDGSLPLIKGSAQNDSRVVVINQKNKGVSAARNAGLSKARGDYIMFVDADDYIARKDALELLIDSVHAPISSSTTVAGNINHKTTTSFLNCDINSALLRTPIIWSWRQV